MIILHILIQFLFNVYHNCGCCGVGDEKTLAIKFVSDSKSVLPKKLVFSGYISTACSSKVKAKVPSQARKSMIAKEVRTEIHGQ